MIRRILYSDRCLVGTMRHGPQIREKATTTGGSLGGRSGGVASSMAYRWVIADRIAHWGVALADSNDKLQAAQKHLHNTILTINNNSKIEEEDSLEANRGEQEEERRWKIASGFALFCRDHMEANPHILQRALSAAHAELKSTTTTTTTQQQPDDDVVAGRGDGGGFSLRFATTWLIAALQSEYRLLSLEERRRYRQHPITTSSSPMSTEFLLQQRHNGNSKNHHTLNVVDEEELCTITTTTGHDDSLGDGECGGMDDLQRAYQRARVELEQRHQDDLEGLVMYTLSKTQRLMQQHRPDLSSTSHHHQDITHPESDTIISSSSSMSVMGIDLGDVVHYPPTGFASFQDRSKSTKKKKTVSSTPTSEQQSGSSSRWAKELAELLKDIPREWASLPRDTRNSWAPNAQRRRKLDAVAALHKADCERAQHIIDKSLRHFKKERKRTMAKTSENKMKGTAATGGSDHKEALQWLLSRRTT